MTNKISLFCLAALSISLAFSACTKKKSTSAQTIYTNCKLPIADGRGGVAIGGFPRYSDRMNTTGSIVATVILVDFPDSAATLTPDDAFAKISGASATFTEMSYGRMQYTFNPIKQWYRMSKSSTEYKLNTFESHRAYITEAVGLADADVDFSTTDSLVILSNPDTTGLGEAGPAFPGSPGYGITADSHEMLNAVTSAHDLNTWGSIWLNHEATHTMGLIDLYAYTHSAGSVSYDDLLRFTGEYSYMGFNSFDSHAPGLTAWERWILGWIDDSQMSCLNPLQTGEIDATISPLGVTGGTKAIVIPVGTTKVLVVESRRAQGIDAKLYKAGALVYTVDSSIQSGKGAIQVYPSSSSDPRFLTATRAAGESVTVGGIKVEVVSSSDQGDTVRITAQ